MLHVFNFCSWEIFDFGCPISGHLFLYTFRYCWIPQNKCSAFPPFFIVLLYSVAVCVSDFFCFWAVWISFLVLPCSSEYFTVCFTSITGQFLVFELRGDFCLEGLSITTPKSTPDGLLEKPSMALLLKMYQVRELMESNFFFY